MDSLKIISRLNGLSQTATNAQILVSMLKNPPPPAPDVLAEGFTTLATSMKILTEEIAQLAMDIKKGLED